MAVVNGSHVLNAVFLLSYVLLSVLIFFIVNGSQPKPYMDEIFHIPQAQKYCNGIFSEWDPKITTPPGLYIISVGILKPISQALGEFICETWHLRLINIVFGAGNLYLLISISRKLHHGGSVFKVAMSGFNLSLFPLLYFFNFLYYTDAGSTFFVLLAYLHHLHGQNAMAASFGALSLFFRQTNIIWVFFMSCEKVTEILISQVRFEKKKKTAAISKSSGQYLIQMFQTLCSMPIHQRKVLLSIVTEILEACASYICVGLAFIFFLIWNGGVVVGDRTAHQMVPHAAQLFYLLGFIVAFANSFLLTWPKVTKFCSFCWEKPVQVIAWMLVAAISLRYLSYEHPYLLADNRHLTFYVWRRFLGKDILRYFFIPLYLYGGWALFNIFQSKNALWKFSFGLCVTLAVVLQPLLEFRYFILPYLFIRLHAPIGSSIQIVTELVVYAAVNFAVLYLFVQYPFQWTGVEEPQRFIW